MRQGFLPNKAGAGVLALTGTVTPVIAEVANSSSLFVPKLLVGAGAAALVTGGVLYAIDQDPGMTTPSLQHCNTAPAGVVVGSVMVAAIGLGGGSSGSFLGRAGAL